jgi:hypothetical protein
MEKVNWLNKQKANYDHFLPISGQASALIFPSWLKVA